VSDLAPWAWWEHLDQREGSLAREATLRAAMALARDGVTGVTVILPRGPGVVVRARHVAAASGIQVRADQINSTTITLKFSAAAEQRPHGARRWPWLPGWLLACARRAQRA
jgi:hypothetical protein